MRTPAIILGAVEREIGVAHQRLHRVAVLRAQRGPDAGADVELVMVDVIRLRKRLDHRLGDTRHAALVGRVADHDRELVAAQPAALLVLAGRRHEPLRHLRQEPVADLVTERVVDRLESVEIDHQERALALPLLGVAHRLAERLGQHQAVREPGQCVVAREIGDLLVGFALLGHVGADAAEAKEVSLVVEHRRARQLPPAPSRIDLDLDQQVGEVLAALQPFRQVVQARRELTACPGISGDELDERRAVERPRITAQGVGKRGRLLSCPRSQSAGKPPLPRRTRNRRRARTWRPPSLR